MTLENEREKQVPPTTGTGEPAPFTVADQNATTSSSSTGNSFSLLDNISFTGGTTMEDARIAASLRFNEYLFNPVVKKHEDEQPQNDQYAAIAGATTEATRNQVTASDNQTSVARLRTTAVTEDGAPVALPAVAKKIIAQKSEGPVVNPPTNRLDAQRIEIPPFNYSPTIRLDGQTGTIQKAYSVPFKTTPDVYEQQGEPKITTFDKKLGSSFANLTYEAPQAGALTITQGQFKAAPEREIVGTVRPAGTTYSAVEASPTPDPTKAYKRLADGIVSDASPAFQSTTELLSPTPNSYVVRPDGLFGKTPIVKTHQFEISEGQTATSVPLKLQEVGRQVTEGRGTFSRDFSTPTINDRLGSVAGSEIVNAATSNRGKSSFGHLQPEAAPIQKIGVEKPAIIEYANPNPAPSILNVASTQFVLPSDKQQGYPTTQRTPILNISETGQAPAGTVFNTTAPRLETAAPALVSTINRGLEPVRQTEPTIFGSSSPAFVPAPRQGDIIYNPKYSVPNEGGYVTPTPNLVKTGFTVSEGQQLSGGATSSGIVYGAGRFEPNVVAVPGDKIPFKATQVQLPSTAPATEGIRITNSAASGSTWLPSYEGDFKPTGKFITAEPFTPVPLKQIKAQSVEFPSYGGTTEQIRNNGLPANTGFNVPLSEVYKGTGLVGRSGELRPAGAADIVSQAVGRNAAVSSEGSGRLTINEGFGRLTINESGAPGVLKDYKGSGTFDASMLSNGKILDPKYTSPANTGLIRPVMTESSSDGMIKKVLTDPSYGKSYDAMQGITPTSKTLMQPPSLYDVNSGRPNIVFPKPYEMGDPTFRDPQIGSGKIPGQTPNAINTQPARVEPAQVAGLNALPAVGPNFKELYGSGQAADAGTRQGITRTNPGTSDLPIGQINKIPGEAFRGDLSSINRGGAIANPAFDGMSGAGRINMTNPGELRADGKLPLGQMAGNAAANATDRAIPGNNGAKTGTVPGADVRGPNTNTPPAAGSDLRTAGTTPGTGATTPGGDLRGSTGNTTTPATDLRTPIGNNTGTTTTPGGDLRNSGTAATPRADVRTPAGINTAPSDRAPVTTPGTQSNPLGSNPARTGTDRTAGTSLPAPGRTDVAPGRTTGTTAGDGRTVTATADGRTVTNSTGDARLPAATTGQNAARGLDGQTITGRSIDSNNLNFNPNRQAPRDPITAFELSTQRIRQLSDVSQSEVSRALDNILSGRVTKAFGTEFNTTTGTDRNPLRFDAEAGRTPLRTDATVRGEAGRIVRAGDQIDAATARRVQDAATTAGAVRDPSIRSLDPQGRPIRADVASAQGDPAARADGRLGTRLPGEIGTRLPGEIDVRVAGQQVAGIGRIPLSGNIRISDIPTGKGDINVTTGSDGRAVGEVGRLPGTRGFNQLSDGRIRFTSEIHAPRGETNRYITGLELALILSIAGIAKLRNDSRAVRLEGRTWSIGRQNGRPMIFLDGRSQPFPIERMIGKGMNSQSFRIMVNALGDRGAQLSTRTMRNADIATRTTPTADATARGLNMGLLGKYHYFNYFQNRTQTPDYYSQFRGNYSTGRMGLAVIMAAASGMTTRGALGPGADQQPREKFNIENLGPADRIRMQALRTGSLLTQFGRFNFDGIKFSGAASKGMWPHEGNEDLNNSFENLDDYEAFLARLDAYAKPGKDEEEEALEVAQGRRWVGNSEYLLFEENAAEAEESAELDEEDTTASALLSKILRRPKWVIEPGQTLDGIAEKLFSNADYGWIIADLNRANTRETYVDGKRIVELISRQEIELPVWQDIQKFIASRRKGETAENLVTIVVERQIDREVVESVLSKVVGAES